MLNCADMKQRFFHAIKNGEFCVWYQPQVDMRSGTPRGAEALVRWKMADGGFVRPAGFVAELERLGLMERLDEEVLQIVCRDIREGKKRGFSPGTVSVNLSRLHAEKAGTADRLKEMVERHGVSRREVSFEITETAENAANDIVMTEFAGCLRENGFRIAMDDYGIGGSTLKLLLESRFDILKLDRHFVSRIGDPRTDIILDSTIAMAGRLGLEVVAEGVETIDQIHFLMRHQCFIGQGYYYSRPLDYEQYVRWKRAAGDSWFCGKTNVLENGRI